ncbi:hypothetical protein B0H19DRAFT_1058201 [Mycena capillaripes]|nr:hypothetical protein B0H19DRAFT_1058201 [Mycena capillaripes]
MQPTPKAAPEAELRQAETFYPVLTLPPEIVSEIFLNYLPTYPEIPPLLGISSPSLLCQICRHWRAIAVSTPVLWRAIRMDGANYRDSEEMLTAQLELVETWLSRSGDCTLSLSLTEFSPNSVFLPRFLETVALHCQRWEYVVLHNTPIEHLHLLRDEMPLLRNLTLDHGLLLSGNVQDPVEVFLRAPRLKSVTTPQYFLKTAIALPWAQLTHFDGGRFYEDESREILRDATHLVDCRLHIRRSYVERRPSFSVVHPHLHHFVLRGAVGANVCRLLDSLTLPSLRTLEVFEPEVKLDSLRETLHPQAIYGRSRIP